MNIDIENLQSEIKRKHVFKYKPEFTESFKTDISENQIIPLTIEVFEKLEWPVVFTDKKSVEAKRKGDFNKLTEKVTVKKNSSGRIEVHSKTIEGNFLDFGKNSKRTGLFIALFKKLSLEYKESGKFVELETEYEKQNNWTDYEIPTKLPQPKVYGKPNLAIAIIGGIIISIGIGLLIGFLTQNFVYFIGVYELGIGLALGYLFSEVLKQANYIEFDKIQIMIGIMAFLVCLTSLYFQYYLIITENNISDLGFIEFVKLRIENGLMIKTLNTGWIGLALSWIFQIVFPFFLAQAKVASSLMNYSIEKIPEKVIEYVIYLFDNEKSESEVRAELASKGWNKKEDQEDVFDAIGAISGFQQNNRE